MYHMEIGGFVGVFLSAATCLQFECAKKRSELSHMTGLHTQTAGELHVKSVNGDRCVEATWERECEFYAAKRPTGDTFLT